jgi:spore coat polysaccharide biosynthesis protein SpsF
MDPQGRHHGGRSVILALIQVRMGSTRFPGKSMAPINGVPLIEHVVHRTSAARMVDKVCVCTTDQPDDDVLAAHVESLGVDVYRGSVDDVLARFYWAAERYPDASIIVRITADDPFKDPTLIDRAIDGFMALQEEYVVHYVELGGITWPLGMQVEVFSREALIDAHLHASDPEHREHVTPWMRKSPLVQIKDEKNRGHIGMRWTLDDMVDYSFALKVYDKLGNVFGYDDMLRENVEVECRKG